MYFIYYKKGGFIMSSEEIKEMNREESETATVESWGAWFEGVESWGD